jgi:hypothetical protein
MNEKCYFTIELLFCIAFFDYIIIISIQYVFSDTMLHSYVASLVLNIVYLKMTSFELGIPKIIDRYYFQHSQRVDKHILNNIRQNSS